MMLVGMRCGRVRSVMVTVASLLLVTVFRCAGHAGEAGEEEEAPPSALPEQVEEARSRARLLHEMIHGALQVVHRDFFDEEESLSIPSRSLEDVFHELQRSHGVDVHWLVVNAAAMSVDNNPRDAFEKEAARAIAAGRAEYESVEEEAYRYVGRIRLASQCLKCHAPNRMSNEDRFAGLVISMPIKPGD